MVPYAKVAENVAQLPNQQLPDYSDLGDFEAMTATMTVDQLWTGWRLGLRENLGEWQPTQFRVWLDEMDEIYRYMVGFGITAGLGLVASVSSFFFTRRSPVQAR